MGQSITVDPVTRIEGHLKFSTKIENSIVIDAKCSAQLYRGIEKALIGYDARAAQQITQRVCGTCNYAHAEAAALALEDAMGIKPNKNGQLLRNLIVGAYQIHDYLFHFYLLSVFDFIDVQAITNYSGTNKNLLKMKQWVETEKKSGKVFPLSNFLPQYKELYSQNEKLNFFSIDSYLEAFEIMLKLDKAVAIFGGKSPHPVTIEAGGVTTTPTVLSIQKYKSLIEEVNTFVKQRYLPNLISIAKEFKEYFHYGKGYANYLAFEYLPDEFGENHLFKGGTIIDGKYAPYDLEKIIEETQYSYYEQNNYTKPLSHTTLTPINYEVYKNEQLKVDGKYSWSKAPRYDTNVMEVGAVARVIITYKQGTNQKLNTLVDKVNKELNITFEEYNSVMGRHLCRAILSCIVVDKLQEDIEKVEPNVSGYDEHEVPSNAKGIGLTEGTRGALAHWIEIDKEGFIKNYEMIVPTTWNISPRDSKGTLGVVEKMLVGTKIKDPKNPIELARIIRSTDPCLACSVH